MNISLLPYSSDLPVEPSDKLKSLNISASWVSSVESANKRLLP
jgi:hypothetical protein